MSEQQGDTSEEQNASNSKQPQAKRKFGTLHDYLFKANRPPKKSKSNNDATNATEQQQQQQQQQPQFTLPSSRSNALSSTTKPQSQFTANRTKGKIQPAKRANEYKGLGYYKTHQSSSSSAASTSSAAAPQQRMKLSLKSPALAFGTESSAAEEVRSPLVGDPTPIATPMTTLDSASYAMPADYNDAWDTEHVRLPCSSSNVYRVVGSGGKRFLSKWYLIRSILSNNIANSIDLEDAIRSINPNHSSKWNFDSLHDFFLSNLSEKENRYFFTHTLPKMQQLCLRLPELFAEPIPLLKKRRDREITLTQEQIACLLTNAFFCTFPGRNSSAKASRFFSNNRKATEGVGLATAESGALNDDIQSPGTPGSASTSGAAGSSSPSPNRFGAGKQTNGNDNESIVLPSINFTDLYKKSEYRGSGGCASFQAHKLKTIIHYFNTVLRQMPRGNVSFHRRVLEEEPDWTASDAPLCELDVRVNGSIEDDGHGMLQVDFANKIVGGGVIGRGCVQEEIRFTVNTELIVSRLFTEELDDDECLFMTGAQRYALYKGYGDSFEFDGTYDDLTPRDSSGRIQTTIVALDAMNFAYESFEFQYSRRAIRRELNKAFCGFQPHTEAKNLYIGRKPLETNDNSNSSVGANIESEEYQAHILQQKRYIATGNWGCGAFAGDRQLKSLIQLMAASQAHATDTPPSGAATGEAGSPSGQLESNVVVTYFTYGDEALCSALRQLYAVLRLMSITVGELFTCIKAYRKRMRSRRDLELFAHVREWFFDAGSESGECTEAVNLEPQNEVAEMQQNQTEFAVEYETATIQLASEEMNAAATIDTLQSFESEHML